MYFTRMPYLRVLGIPLFALTLCAAPRFIKPAPFSVVTGDRVRLEVDIDPLKADSVVFYYRMAETKNFNTFNAQSSPFLRIGPVAVPPYEFAWDCHGIPDQYLKQKWLMAVIFLQGSGTDTVFPESSRPLFFDRNQEYKTIALNVPYLKKNIRIDGVLDEWRQLAPVLTLSTDNLISLWSFWNETGLYFASMVHDRHLTAISPRLPLSEEFEGSATRIIPLWYDDNIELCFDRVHDRNVYRDTGDCEIIISVDSTQGNVFDYQNGQVYIWGTGVRKAVQILGTVNNYSDRDSGYTVELFIPWTELRMPIPRNNDTIGFDFFNGNWEREDGKCIRTTWSGVSIAANDFPSEWGNLVFVRNHNRPCMLVLLICAGIVLFAFIVILRKVRSAPKMHPIGDPLDAVLLHIKENLGNADLRIEDAARIIAVNKGKFSILFNQKTGMTFPQYLNTERITLAQCLLSGTEKSITEISMEAGYNSLEHFSTVFKKAVGTTPSDYRKKEKSLS